MNAKVRRVENGIVKKNSDSDVIPAVESFPMVPRCNDKLTVNSQVSLGVDPRIVLSWNVDQQYWDEGFTLLGFRSSSGFATKERPEDLAMHGEMFLEESADGKLEGRLSEGTYFYTFVLRRLAYCGFLEKFAGIVRFFESIPSAKTAIARIEDQLKLRQLEQDCELHGIKSEVARNEAMIALQQSKKKLEAMNSPKPDDTLEAQVRKEVDSELREKLKKAQTRIDFAVALQDLQKKMKRNPALKKFDEKQREQLLKEVFEDLNAKENHFRA